MQNRKFYISLMIGAICVVAVATVCLNSYDGNKVMDDTGGLVAEAVTPTPREDIADKYEKNVGTISKSDVGYSIPTVRPLPTDIPDGSYTYEEYVTVSATEDENIKNSNDINISKDSQNIKDKKSKNKSGKSKKSKKDKNSKSKIGEDEELQAVLKTGPDVSSLKFDQEAGIIWPVNGEVVMKYSPDNPVLFKTLGQYKSNPAMIISADVGTKVSSAADAVVTEIGNNEEIGNYVETAIGDDFRIIYGQIDNITVKTGDSLKEGEIIGSIAEPTKYYIDEGSNLYLKMTCDKETVDPMIFLR